MKTYIPATEQIEQFVYEPTQEELNSFIGKEIKPGVILLSAPRRQSNRWVCLANVIGALCLIEVSLYEVQP